MFCPLTFLPQSRTHPEWQVNEEESQIEIYDMADMGYGPS